ncbi:hypothetical protein [Anaerotignum sp.]
MGFLQKDWDWEQTDPVQGEKKPVESRKGLWALSLLALALSLFVLYYVEHTLYGEIIRTNTLTFGSVLLGSISNIYAEDKEQKWERVIKLLVGIILFLCGSAVLYALVTMEPQVVLLALQLASLLPVYLVLRTKKEQFQREREAVTLWSIFFISVLLAAATLAAPYLMGITTTVQKARESLTQNGYEAVSYIGHDDPTYPLIPKDIRMDLEEKELKFDLYLFEMRKDKIPWVAVVNPMTGETLRLQTRKDDMESFDSIMRIKERNQ